MLMIVACQDPNSLGSDLLSEENINLKTESNFVLEASTAASKPTVTLIQNLSNYSSYAIGTVEDPIFGKYSSEVYTKLIFNTSASIPVFAKAKIDSVVMVMSYDSTSTYGNGTEVHDIRIEEVTSLPKFRDSIFSDVKIPDASLVRIADKKLTPRPKDSVALKDYLADTITNKVTAQIRVQLSNSYWTSKLTKTLDLSSTTALQEAIKAIKISSASKNSLLGLNFSSVADDANAGVNGIYVYYKDSSDTRRVYRFLYSAFKFATFASTPTSTITSKVGSIKAGEEAVYLRGFDGENINVTIKDLDRLKGKVINFATLELVPTSIPNNDLKLYPLIYVVSTAQKTSSGTTPIRDIRDLVNASIPINIGYGGEAVTKTGFENGVYKLNVTKAVQDVIRGTISNSFELSVNGKNQRPHRAVFNGTKHPTAPMRLVVTYTDPKK